MKGVLINRASIMVPIDDPSIVGINDYNIYLDGVMYIRISLKRTKLCDLYYYKGKLVGNKALTTLINRRKRYIRRLPSTTDSIKYIPEVITVKDTLERKHSYRCNSVVRKVLCKKFEKNKPMIKDTIT